MDTSFFQVNQQIKKEADHILYEKGLLAILNAYGATHISGSYALDLMTWRDLDIYLESKSITTDDFFLLGRKISGLLEPVKMSFRNEMIGKTKGLPNGLYWGVYLGNERKGAWKIDVWSVSSEECKRLLDHCAGISKQLTKENSLYILDIKSQCWQDPEYRRSYSSADIYEAVLNQGITNIKEFLVYLHQKNTKA